MANQVVRDTSANMQVDNTHQIPSALQPPPHTAAGPGGLRRRMSYTVGII